MAAKTIMIQGTASSAGKSVLAAALCRIFKQDGYRVAPFKSQNMALNSFVTREGGEMGRAQVVQAEAAGVDPHVDMNPILLKPEADARCQIIVQGRVYTTLRAWDYYQERDKLLVVVAESLDRLRAAYDVVVIEGAGSPAEVNLKDREIVNMRVAKLAQAPVLLVGDIDRGGVFAALVGTLNLLDPDERALVKGLVINKFRGDLSLLDSGLTFLEQRTGVPVLGVVPFFRDIKVAEEDSVYLDRRPQAAAPGLVDVAVVRLAHISNFDDFDPLEQEPGVSLRYVSGPAELGRPDLIVLPGTKSTVADLHHLRQTGLAEAIVARAEEGAAVIGICGGYQMLGREIHDPEAVESDQAVTPGLGLLPTVTIFRAEKATHQVRARVECARGLLAGAGGHEVGGYEIRMGESEMEGDHPLQLVERSGRRMEQPDGAIDAEGRVLGTYLHGLFQNDVLRLSVLRYLAAAKGIEEPAWGAIASRDEQYNNLAALVRASLNMEQLYRICGL